ncbi:MAG: hypothetical protein M3Y91_09060 [Actinomycetota bacterium]|nr:hypothetical protein [Actinomycetota bacterium]
MTAKTLDWSLIPDELSTLYHLRDLQTRHVALEAHREAVRAGPLETEGWERWVTTLFPRLCIAPFADHHRQFWEWLWAITPNVRPDPFIAIWPRGGAKSSSAEAACVALGARRRRTYGVYVSMGQDQADDHVGNVAAMLESAEVGAWYPTMAERALGKYGNSKGWRRNRLRTRAGFILDAIGLDTAARGAKIDEDRPDFLIIDDIDDQDDSPRVTDSKIAAITRGLIPAGSADVAILAIQNLVHPDSTFARLADGRAEFLTHRIVSGPIPAVQDLAVDHDDLTNRWTITGGTPTWAGQDLAVCQAQIDDWGISAFRDEAQHEVTAPKGGMYNHVAWLHADWADVPWDRLLRIVVWLDPAVTKSDSSDACALQCDAIDVHNTIWRLYSWERRATPQEAMAKALKIAAWLGADQVGVETDQGGDTWLSVYREAAQRTGIDLPFRSEKAGEGHGSKVARSSLMLADYERPGRNIVHVVGPTGSHKVLEQALERFPRAKPFDLTDAAYWSWWDLRKRNNRPFVPPSQGGRQGPPGITDGLWDMQL